MTLTLSVTPRSQEIYQVVIFEITRKVGVIKLFNFLSALIPHEFQCNRVPIVIKVNALSITLR